MRPLIRDAGKCDAKDVADIYNHYIAETIVTFEQDTVTEVDMAERISACQSDGYLWLVAELDGKVVGYAYASKWKSRWAYRFSVEATVYLAPSAVGFGIGTSLYERLLGLLSSSKYKSVISGISLPNLESIALHEKFGFEKVAHFKDVGFKFERWIDVGYWQLQV